MIQVHTNIYKVNKETSFIFIFSIIFTQFLGFQFMFIMETRLDLTRTELSGGHSDDMTNLLVTFEIQPPSQRKQCMELKLNEYFIRKIEHQFKSKQIKT